MYDFDEKHERGQPSGDNVSQMLRWVTPEYEFQKRGYNIPRELHRRCLDHNAYCVTFIGGGRGDKRVIRFHKPYAILFQNTNSERGEGGIAYPMNYVQATKWIPKQR